MSLLLKLGGDPVPQLTEEVNSWFIDRSQYVYRNLVEISSGAMILEQVGPTAGPEVIW